MEQQSRPTDARTADAAADFTHAARSGVLQMLSVAGQALMPATHILIARLFGVATFGAYQASVAVVEVLARAGPLGAIGGLHRFVAAHRAAGEPELALRAVGTGVRATAAAAGTLALALALVAPTLARAWHEPSLAATLPIMAPAVLLSSLTVVLVAATMGAKVARMNLYVRGMAEPLLLLLTALVAWRLGAGLRGLAVAHVTASAAVAGLAVAACARVFGAPQLGQALATGGHPTFVRFAVPLGVSDLLSAILQRADMFVIASFAGFEAVALYAAAEFITRVIANPRYVFDHIIAPVLAEALHAGDRERVRYNLALVTRWVVTATSPIAATVIVLRAEILGLYGAPFVASSGTLVVLALANLVSGSLGLTPYVIAMGGRSRLMLLNNLGAAALNIALGVVLVPRIGVVGAAVAVLASATTFQVALTLEAWALERVHPFTASLVKPVMAAFAALVVEALVHRYVAAPAARVSAVIGAGAVTYGAMLLALGLEAEERDVLRRARDRLRRPRLR